MPMNIAIDGPVGAGKSSIADQVAQRLHILHLDTGAMYRTVALYMLRNGIDPQDEQTVSAHCGEADVRVAYRDGAQRTMLGGEDVSDLIRTGEVSTAASAISKWPAVRRRMVAAQREIAATADMLIDGRDIGTRVLIDAPVKIFLTATPEERARRRYRQQIEKGDMTPYEQVLAELNARDAQDMNRETDPLRQAEDAVLVDSTNMTPEQVVDAIIAVVEDVYGAACGRKEARGGEEAGLPDAQAQIHAAVHDYRVPVQAAGEAAVLYENRGQGERAQGSQLHPDGQPPVPARPGDAGAVRAGQGNSLHGQKRAV